MEGGSLKELPPESFFGSNPFETLPRTTRSTFFWSNTDKRNAGSA
jgi:hypothetical protein